jgi:hypothetical protein
LEGLDDDLDDIAHPSFTERFV